MLRVLVIDDESLVRRGIVMETDWQSLGCVVVGEAADGKEGLEAARKYQPDLIISDIRMPHMNGIDMLRTLREENNPVQVIFLTAYSDFEYCRAALKLLAFDYLLKPFEDGELEEAVKKVKQRIEKKQGEENKQEDFVLNLKTGTAEKSAYIREALAYISEHYAEGDIAVGTIAESVGLSEGHLSHLFKKETDYTVMSYITRYRMQAAMKLLRNCRYKVYEVAEMVGYKDITYFSTTFKKVVGVSPSEFQNKAL